MTHLDETTGQRIDHKSHNDNAPPRYSAPGAAFKEALSYYSNRSCSRCRGTGYIGQFNWNAGGRCFQCISDQRWTALLGKFQATGIRDDAGEVCEIRHVSKDAYGYDGFVVAPIGLPPVGEFCIFDTYEEACEFASEEYGV